MKYKAAIFDMDGTVLDTLEDLKNAINFTMEKFGHRGNFTTEEVGMFFGSGAEVAIRRAIAKEKGIPMSEILDIGKEGEKKCTTDKEDKEILEMLEFYKPYYKERSAIKTDAYPGINEMLKELIKGGVKIAVVSNKPDAAVKSLCLDYFPIRASESDSGERSTIFPVAMGEQPGIDRKPAPDMVEKAMDLLNAKKSETVYIGDSEVDIQTAKNSGIPCISVDWGFRTRGFLENLGAETIVSSPMEILDILLITREQGDKHAY